MNDIDRRCDAYLSWLDAQRRNRAPVLNEIAAIAGTAGAIMGVAGAGTEALAIAAAAFGLASTTYSNWNSRLLLDVEHSTVQTLVYTRQQQFRLVNVGLVVPDSASAIYLLRGYLRICMPITIETDINTSVTLMQRGAPQSVLETSVVRPFILPPATARVFRELIPSSPRAPLPGAAGQPGGPKPEPTIEQARGEVEPGMPISLGCQWISVGPGGGPRFVDIEDWRLQVLFAALTAFRALNTLLDRLGRFPSALELYQELCADNSVDLSTKLQKALDDTAALVDPAATKVLDAAPANSLHDHYKRL